MASHPLGAYLPHRGKRKYLPIVQPFFAALDTGDFRAVTSTLTLLEVMVQPLRQGDQNLARQYREILLRSSSLRTVPLTSEIAEQAAQIRAVANLKTPDAIQLATALSSGAHVLLTNDTAMPAHSDLQILVLDRLMSAT